LEEVHIERPDGLRGIALVDIEAVKDSDGNIVGAVNCFQDITERKRNEGQLVNLAHEAEHRAKNILSTVLATVRHAGGIFRPQSNAIPIRRAFRQIT
jgi:hypothetical protein